MPDPSDRPHALSIRPAGPDDADALWSILRPVFQAGETYAQPRDISRDAALAYWCAPGHAVHLAEAADGPLGTFYLCANAAGGGDHVANAAFATAERARGRGIARAMLSRALDLARERGFAAMQFNFVVETNAPALALWQSAGFAEIGRIPGGFRHPTMGMVDALILHRAL